MGNPHKRKKARKVQAYRSAMEKETVKESEIILEEDKNEEVVVIPDVENNVEVKPKKKKQTVAE
jgi:hypothetical protein